MLGGFAQLQYQRCLGYFSVQSLCIQTGAERIGLQGADWCREEWTTQYVVSQLVISWVCSLARKLHKIISAC